MVIAVRDSHVLVQMLHESWGLADCLKIQIEFPVQLGDYALPVIPDFDLAIP